MKKIYCKPQIQIYDIRMESKLNTDSPGITEIMEAKESDFSEEEEFGPRLSHNTLWDDGEE